MSISPRRMYYRKTVYFLNSHVPITHDNITDAIGKALPDCLYAVPYVLKLLSERPQGLEALKNCKDVVTTGSQCPNELGDQLVDRGVNLISWFGS